MALQASGPISFSQISAEFGTPSGKNLGAYRISQSVGTFTNLPLDTGIPQSGTIKFSNFYSKRLNVILNCTGMPDLTSRVNARSLYVTPSSISGVSVTVIGGLKSKPSNTGGSKIYINTNTRIGSAQGSVQTVAFRTGSWDTGTDLRLENGTSGLIVGSGGGGGNGGGTAGGGGSNGTSALGIDYPTTITNRGTIRAGGGGGGGGGGGYGRARYRRGFGFAFSATTAYGGGGGGGAGYPSGSAGSPRASAGSLYTAGGGGSSQYTSATNCNAYGGAGGSGGLAAAGGAGQNGSQGSSGTQLGGQYAGTGGSGGATGYAIVYYNNGSGSSLTNFGAVTGTSLYNTSPV